MSSAVQERKEAPVVQWPTDPVTFLKENLKIYSAGLLFAFLKTYSNGLRRDRDDNEAPHSFTVLDGDFSHCNEGLVNHLMKRCLTASFDTRKAVFQDESEPDSKILARTFGVPDVNDGNPTDIANIRKYQKDRIHPGTFQPLDYFKQGDETQEFVTAQVEILMGDAPISAAEYFCPYTRGATKEDSATGLVEAEPTIQIRRMDKRDIGTSLKHIAALFERIVKPAKAYTADALKKDLAEFAYKWTFTSPFDEESGDILHLMQTALAGLHGFKFKVSDKVKIYDLALSKPYFPTFLQKYKSVVKITQ
jgi:hypothetical protein